MASAHCMILPTVAVVQGPALIPNSTWTSDSRVGLKTQLPCGRKRSSTKSTARFTCFSNSSTLSSPGVEALPSLYSLLGLDQAVEHSQIKAAYRRMALKYHPDVSPPESRELNTKIFLQVQDAYDILSDPISRQDYDQLLKQKVPPTGYVRGWEQAARNRGGRSQARRTDMDAVAESWKAQWQAQLERLQSMDSTRVSWGSRMRFQHRHT